MRRLAAGVSVITTDGKDGARYGLTATAVCSVSADPPTLLICVNRAASTCAAIRAAGHFAVNLLCVDDREVAVRFASPISPEERFKEGVWGTLVTGSPVLESALTVFDCTLSQDIEVATHGILLGQVRGVRYQHERAEPLLYAHGTFVGVASFEAAKRSYQSQLTGRISSDPAFLEDGLHWGLL
jgi:flavin reductase (DIM6/NTAB) family NADH-FMN oxidoreductase RutF